MAKCGSKYLPESVANVVFDYNLRARLLSRGMCLVMPVKIGSSPKFYKNQSVCFVGGDGIIRRCMLESGFWIYLVEMPLGTKPDFGRVGAETMVMLSEADLWE